MTQLRSAAPGRARLTVSRRGGGDRRAWPDPPDGRGCGSWASRAGSVMPMPPAGTCQRGRRRGWRPVAAGRGAVRGRGRLAGGRAGRLAHHRFGGSGGLRAGDRADARSGGMGPGRRWAGAGRGRRQLAARLGGAVMTAVRGRWPRPSRCPCRCGPVCAGPVWCRRLARAHGAWPTIRRRLLLWRPWVTAWVSFRSDRGGEKP